MSSNSIITLTNFINNEFVPPSSNEYLNNIEPATGKLLSYVPRSVKEDVDLAVEAASNAFYNWSNTAVEIRAGWLEKIAARIEQRFEEFVRAESIDTGKPYTLAKSLDIPRAIDNFKFFARAIRMDETSSHQMADAFNYSLRSAVGVSVLITPWNLPLYLLSWKVAPALACGNTIVCKPSELTPMTASLLAEVISEIDLPSGVFNLVHGSGIDIGTCLTSHPDVSLVSFTGGTATGAKVGASAASSFKKLSLELGGKNATIVFDDCDLKQTVEGVVRASFLNSGQICLCGSRLFVQRGIFDKFINLLVERTKEYTVGDPAFSNIGALISADHRKKVNSYVELARTEGANIMCGGCIPELPAPFNEGFFYMPTIVTGLPATSRCSREEIFGPVLVVHVFDDEKDLLPAVNNTKYGLAGSIWTQNLTRAHKVAQAVHTGMLWINCWLKRDLRVPFGGVKESGIGREGGKLSIDFYSELKNVCVQL